MSGYWEIDAAVSPARDVVVDGSPQLLVRVQIVDLDNADPSAAAFIDLPSTQARRIALEILAAADDTDWQTEQDGCPEPARMSAPDAAPITSVPPARVIPARARALAAQLAGLFEADQEIVLRLNDAHHHLLAGANDRLRSDPAADRFVVHEQVHRAFWTYQQASEQRRQLAVDVGELSQQLADALTAAGHPSEHARSANVHQLAAGTWQPTDAREEKQR